MRSFDKLRSLFWEKTPGDVSYGCFWYVNQRHSYFCVIMGKSKEISHDIRKRNVELHKSGSTLSKFPDCSRCHVFSSNYHNSIQHKNVRSSYFSGRRRVAFWWEMCSSTPEQMLNSWSELLSTVKRILDQHGLKGQWERSHSSESNLKKARL